MNKQSASLIIKVLKVGDKFNVTYLNQVVELISIVDRRQGKKLPERLLIWKDHNSEGTSFENKDADLLRAIVFCHWEKIN